VHPYINYPARKAHAPEYIVFRLLSVRLYSIFPW